jgi:O-antigen ligase
LTHEFTVSDRVPRLTLLLLRALWIAWMMALPLGHVTGLRNTLAVLTLGVSLVSLGLSGLKDLPGRHMMLAYGLWATASLAWSADPGVSLAKLKSDLWIPFAAYCAAFCVTRAERTPKWVLSGLALGLLLLAAISMFDVAPTTLLDQWIPEDSFLTIERPLPHWYPGVGDASMFAILCLGPLLSWMFWKGRNRRLRSVLLVGALLVVIVVSKNRNTFAVLPLALIVFFLCLPWRDRARSAVDPSAVLIRGRLRLALWAVSIATVLLVPLAIEAASRERLIQLTHRTPPWGTAALALFQTDARPLMWREYLRLGMQHPWIGIGYGRTLPGLAYDSRDNPILAGQERAAISHAHNILLNDWLQLGAVGLALYVGLFVELIRHARRKAEESEVAAIAYAGITATLVAALVRNLSDDFLIYAMATVLWASLGALFGMQTLRDGPHRSLLR